ncbi:30480_t:CDS:2 [Gigaspora margarita]|uniref:30480_t:CDS:1 n=1 Tax=Gigaspora margarita TaxID=4874 RepID=A0ABN7VUQ9_GIGMA|nr:30480_t:CDS:2 [Gigaspora margarita]
MPKIKKHQIPQVNLPNAKYDELCEYLTNEPLVKFYDSSKYFCNQTIDFHNTLIKINDELKEKDPNYKNGSVYAVIHECILDTISNKRNFEKVNPKSRKHSTSSKSLIESPTHDLNNDQDHLEISDSTLVISNENRLNSNLIQAPSLITENPQSKENKDRIWQNNINTINSNWKFSFETLAQTFSNTFSEQIRKSNIYQTTEKAYEELKIDHEVLVKNFKDLEINHKNTKKELETATKENTNLDKELTLKKQELATANKENANLAKKLTINEQELETANKENANLDKNLSIKEQELDSVKKENANLKIKEQELETANKENANLDKKLSIKEQELDSVKKENANLNKKLTEKEQDYEESQTKIKDLTKKIESLEKEIKILEKQRILGEERKKVIRELTQAYKELKETVDKIKQEKIEKEIKEHQEILEKADKSLNDNEEC